MASVNPKRGIFSGARHGRGGGVVAVVAAALFGGAGALAQQQADTPALAGVREWPAAVLQGLDKTTARVSTVVAPIGAVARFGTLAITARACEKKPPTEPPESAAYLEIVDVRPDSPSVALFAGWMFASSPAISALEHPVYDVWVVDCRGQVADEGGGTRAAAPPAVGIKSGAEEAVELIEDPEGDAEPGEPDTPGAQ